MDDGRADSSHAQAPKLSPGVPIIVGANRWAVGRFGRGEQADLLRISLKLRDLRMYKASPAPIVILSEANDLILATPRRKHAYS